MTMATRTPQLDHWTGEFGDTYVDRNAAQEEQVRNRLRALLEIFRSIEGDPPRSVLECGCNIGLNTRAFRRFLDAELFAVEPNAKAREIVLRDGVLDDAHLKDATLHGLPFADGSMDLVFTSGVLIHVHPDHLPTALDEMHRVSSKYVMMIEYFSQKPESVPYRDRTDLLWKRDFGKAMLERHPDLLPVGCGFFWSRLSGLDDVTWWMFRKP